MKFQLVSDLHLEISSASYSTFAIPAHTPNLFLLGDIGLTKHPELFTSFLPRHLRTFTRVFYLLGNHEAYHSSYASSVYALTAFAASWNTTSSTGEFIFLNRARYDFPATPVTVLGCTLFSAVASPREADALMRGLNDFQHIAGGWTVGAHDAAHRGDVAWLNDAVAACEREAREVLVVTHHAPTLDARAGDPRHEGSALSAGFRSDLRGQSCWESKVVRIWGWGHTHYNWEAMERGDVRTGGGGRCVANMRGYVFAECKGFDAGRVYVIGEEEEKEVNEGERGETAVVGG